MVFKPHMEETSTKQEHKSETDIDYQNTELVYALSNFKGLGKDQLSFNYGDVINIHEKTTSDWWWAEKDGCHGYVPVNHLTYSSVQELFWQDEEYFSNYGNLKIHHEMLSDHPRNDCYQKAITRNAEYLKDMVVLDVGCGSGILSLMCAKYGQPKKVYAVEASPMAEHTRDIVASNGYEDVIAVLHSHVENAELAQEVDVIISEWMGTLLLFEMMIESVIIARNKYLKSGGIVWPSQASLFLVPCQAQDRYDSVISFWDNQYGFDFSALKGPATEEFFEKPCHNYDLEREHCLSAETRLFSLDLLTVNLTELEEIERDFDFHITKDGPLHGFCTWFQADFKGLNSEVKTTSLNTGPDCERTHWRQNLFMLDQPVQVTNGDLLVGSATVKRNPEWRRHLRFLLQFDHISAATQLTTHVEKEFLVWR